MAYIVAYNKIDTLAGYQVVAPAPIRQYVEHKGYLILNVSPSKSDEEYKSFQGGNVFCYDEYANLKWQSKSKNVAEIYIEKDGLHFYDTSSLGYDCLIDIETGNIIKMEPTK
jgi:hypothetical protein